MVSCQSHQHINGVSMINQEVLDGLFSNFVRTLVGIVTQID